MINADTHVLIEVEHSYSGSGVCAHVNLDIYVYENTDTQNTLGSRDLPVPKVRCTESGALLIITGKHTQQSTLSSSSGWFRSTQSLPSVCVVNRYSLTVGMLYSTSSLPCDPLCYYENKAGIFIFQV